MSIAEAETNIHPSPKLTNFIYYLEQLLIVI